MRKKNILENDTFFEHISQFNRGPDIFCKIFVFIFSVIYENVCWYSVPFCILQRPDYWWN